MEMELRKISEELSRRISIGKTMIGYMINGVGMTMNIYQENGFVTRTAYLDSLASEYGEDSVFTLSDILGPEEDFDGLLNILEDHD
jgi:hypothetical protein